jgi:hypothetical protein
VNRALDLHYYLWLLSTSLFSKEQEKKGMLTKKEVRGCPINLKKYGNIIYELKCLNEF